MRQRAWVARLPRTRGRRRPAWHPPALVKVIGVLMSVVLAATLSPASDAHARPAAAVANGSGADIRVGGVAIEALPVDRSPVRAGQDLKLEFDFTGDPDMTEGVMDRIAQDLKRIDSDYPVFSDWLAEQLDEHRVDEGDVTSKSGSGQLRFDARTAVSGKTVSFTVPGSDVYTSTSWWQGFLISAMSVALGLASAGVCLALAPSVAPACGFVGGFVGAFSDNLVTALVDHELDAEKWGDIFGRSLFFGAIGALGGVTGADQVPRILTFVGEKLTAWGARMARSWRVLTRLADGIGAVVTDNMIETFRRLMRNHVGSGDVRLMPLGDSITYGVESSDGTGYRDELYDQLEKVAESVDFVGSVRNGRMSDPDNEGHPGDRIDEIAGFAACNVYKYQPNVITLHAGTNDMNQNHSLPSAPNRLKQLIDRALKDSPLATVLVAQLIPTGKAGLQPRIDAYNAALPAMVGELQGEGKRVALVGMSRVLVSDGLENDAHPTDAGYAKMADAWFRAFQEAQSRGWIRTPAAQKEISCNDFDHSDPGSGSGQTALGAGWRALGVIAPGYDSGGGRTVMAEMNGDKRADYVQIRQDGSIRVGINTENKPGQPSWKNWGGGSGVFAPAGGAGNASLGSYVRFADIDGNGRDDYVVLLGSDEKATLADVWLNLPGSGGGPSWGEDMPRLRIPIENARLDRLRFADVNGDGRDDVLRVGEAGEVHAYLNVRRTGSLQPDWEEKLSWAPGVQGAKGADLRFADVDGDNRADYLMVGGDGSVHAYLNRGGKGGGGFEKRHNFANASNYPRPYVQFSDISGDGKADYLVIYDGGAVRSWLNRGGNGNELDPTPPGGNGNELDPTPPGGS